MAKIQVEIQTLVHFEGLELPSYATEWSAGVDLRAAIEEPVVLQPMQRYLMPTGLIMALPQGYEAQVRPRSGLAIKHGLTLINTPGTIDADYRGEIKIPLIHLGSEPIEITRGMRIAQMIVSPVNQVTWVSVQSVKETQRGSGGFGHSGTQ